VAAARERLEASEREFGDIFGQYTLQQTDLLNLEIDAKEARDALAAAVKSQKELLAEQSERMTAAEKAYTAIVDELMDLVEAVPEQSGRIYGMLSQLREVLDAGQEVVEANRIWAETQSG
jgi:predicted  nucleic acid-binding Zn-ribbon protein